MAKAIHMMVRVLDEARSVDFYRRAFGLDIADRFAFDSFTLVYLRNAEADFEVFLDMSLEILLLGTGSKQRFPHPRLTQALARRRIGVEVMDLQAACRTYNILMAEERRVAAALLFS